MSVFVCGSLHLDVIVTAPHLPRPDETVVGRDVAYAFGGKGGNQAVAAARMGAATAMLGRVGRDAFGAQLLAGLAEAGVDAAQVTQGDSASGMSVAILDAAGTYGAVIVSAANLEIDAADLRLPPDARVLLLQNEIPEAANLAAARVARAAGARVILNAAPARAMGADLLALTDVLVVNRVEAADLLAQDVAALNATAAALALTALGPAEVIVTLGADGLVLCRAGQAVTMSGHRVQTVSTHGAGDAFLGALAAALDHGAPLDEACTFGQAAAALHVSLPFSDRQLLSAAAVRAFLA